VLDNHLNAVVIFQDLSKARVIPNHQILLFKLEICAVRVVLKSWFKSHLINHNQTVEIAKIGNNNTMHTYSSLYRQTIYGVAHGSILGPICFLFCVNYLSAYVQCANLVLYADEACLFDNWLVLNTAETCAMLFHFSFTEICWWTSYFVQHIMITYSPKI